MKLSELYKWDNQNLALSWERQGVREVRCTDMQKWTFNTGWFPFVEEFKIEKQYKATTIKKSLEEKCRTKQAEINGIYSQDLNKIRKVI